VCVLFFLFLKFTSGYDTVKIIEINREMMELWSNMDCPFL